MNVVKLSVVLVFVVGLMPGCATESENIETEQLAHMHDGCVAEAVMQTGDFDGDGVVTPADLDMLNAYKDDGDYAAYFDMNADGRLTGRDVSIVARNMGDAGSARDAQMAQMWAGTEKYRNILVAIGDGFAPLTPDLQGHGIHFARLDLVFGWTDRGGFNAGEPEGLNYSESGELLAVFYYGLGATDLHNLAPHVPAGAALANIAPPNGFAGGMSHDWHQHVGPCFGRFTAGYPPAPVPGGGLTGFDQCLTEAECAAVPPIPGQLQIWSAQFHMLHVWAYQFNECGVHAGINDAASPGAPEEPHHGECTIEDVVPEGTVLVSVPPLF